MMALFAATVAAQEWQPVKSANFYERKQATDITSTDFAIPEEVTEYDASRKDSSQQMKNLLGSKPVSRWSAGCLSHDGKNFSGRGKTFLVGNLLHSQLEVDIDGDFVDGTLETYGCSYSDTYQGQQEYVSYWPEAKLLDCTAFRYTNSISEDGKISQNIQMVAGIGLVAASDEPYPAVGEGSPYDKIASMVSPAF